MDNIFIVHIISAIIGQVVVFSAALISIFFLFRQEKIKNKLLSKNSFSLEFLADVIHVLLKIGFLLLSIGVISGLCIYLFSVAGSKYKFKLIWSVLIWGWYCGILLAYNFSYCSRKRIAEMSVLGCSLLIGSLFGVGFK
jgi:ABC-type uncharacterized transport system permease subunit